MKVSSRVTKFWLPVLYKPQLDLVKLFIRCIDFKTGLLAKPTEVSREEFDKVLSMVQHLELLQGARSHLKSLVV